MKGPGGRGQVRLRDWSWAASFPFSPAGWAAFCSFPGLGPACLLVGRKHPPGLGLGLTWSLQPLGLWQGGPCAGQQVSRSAAPAPLGDFFSLYWGVNPGVPYH